MQIRGMKIKSDCLFFKKSAPSGANSEQINKNSPPRYLEGLFMCSGRESNPYGHCCPRDFLATLAFTQAGFIRNAKPL